MSKSPNSELVCRAWLKTISGLPTDQIGTRLPRDNATWSASGYVQVGPVIGGSADIYVPARSPIIQVDCYAVSPDSDVPPWWKANVLAEAIVAGCYDPTLINTPLTLPSGYGGARVTSAYIQSEPRRVRGDVASYAKYTLDLAFHWTAL